jgi:hypothetical protein
LGHLEGKQHFEILGFQGLGWSLPINYQSESQSYPHYYSQENTHAAGQPKSNKMHTNNYHTNQRAIPEQVPKDDHVMVRFKKGFK